MEPGQWPPCPPPPWPPDPAACAECAADTAACVAEWTAAETAAWLAACTECDTAWLAWCAGHRPATPTTAPCHRRAWSSGHPGRPSRGYLNQRAAGRASVRRP